MRKLSKSLLGGLALTSLLCTASGVWADDDNQRNHVKARLQGFNEVPAVSSTGTGRFQARIVDDSSIDLGGRPACTATSGTFTGTVTAADVIGPAAQGIAAGEIAEIIRAMRAGIAYANVHTNKHPTGEIRGQLRTDDD